MAEIAYEWDFERNPWDNHSAALTFSVGVFQWQPKASGKGMKRSKTIRVKGYVAEADAVYEFARSLCTKLNEAEVDADNPPDWVQKQYSVPKPKDLVIERRSDDLLGSQVRSARLQVMQRELLPKGFVKGKGNTYVRKQGDQIHLIDFQPATWGHQYTINLGFHYTFVPPFFQRKRVKVDAYQLLDCGIHSRLGQHIGDRRDLWFKYGDDIVALKEEFSINAQLCLSIFAEYSKQWNDPAWWLERTKQSKISHRRTRPWDTEAPHYLNLFVACVATHLGKKTLATQLLNKLINEEKSDWQRRFFEQQLRKAQR